MGFQFESYAPDIDEKAIRHNNPKTLVLAIAKAKAAALQIKLGKMDAVLITSDQVTLYKDEIREKPIDMQQTRAFIDSYSGDKASTITAIVITNLNSGKQFAETDLATIYFKEIPETARETIIQECDLLNCSGGFVIDHPLAEPYIEKIEGESSSIIGLPEKLTRELLLKAGYDPKN